MSDKPEVAWIAASYNSSGVAHAYDGYDERERAVCKNAWLPLKRQQSTRFKRKCKHCLRLLGEESEYDRGRRETLERVRKALIAPPMGPVYVENDSDLLENIALELGISLEESDEQ